MNKLCDEESTADIMESFIMTICRPQQCKTTKTRKHQITWKTFQLTHTSSLAKDSTLYPDIWIRYLLKFCSKNTGSDTSDIKYFCQAVNRVCYCFPPKKPDLVIRQENNNFGHWSEEQNTLQLRRLTSWWLFEMADGVVITYRE